jgi:hypothetical protein
MRGTISAIAAVTDDPQRPAPRSTGVNVSAGSVAIASRIAALAPIVVDAGLNDRLLRAAKGAYPPAAITVCDHGCTSESPRDGFNAGQAVIAPDLKVAC